MFASHCSLSWHDFIVAYALLFLLSAGSACTTSGDGITGQVFHDGRPVAGASVSAYLKEGDFGGGSPFMMVETDGEGRFALKTGKGKFYIVARKTEYSMGREHVLKGRPQKEPVSSQGGKDIVILLTSVDEGEFSPDPGTFVTGRVTSANGNVSGTFVYAYDSGSDFSSGPTFLTKTQVDADGDFRLAVKAGTYHIVAMRKESGSEVGPLTGSGLRGEYGNNPVVIEKGVVLNIGTLELFHPDPAKLEDLAKRGGVDGSRYVIAGRVLLEDGSPAQGVYVMAYGDARMVGRPRGISETSDEDGRFTLYLPVPGRYYLGSRESIGGPLSPGELTGAYEGTADHSVELSEKENIHGLMITVREKW